MANLAIAFLIVLAINTCIFYGIDTLYSKLKFGGKRFGPARRKKHEEASAKQTRKPEGDLRLDVIATIEGLNQPPYSKSESCETGQVYKIGYNIGYDYTTQYWKQIFTFFTMPFDFECQENLRKGIDKLAGAYDFELRKKGRKEKEAEYVL